MSLESSARGKRLWQKFLFFDPVLTFSDQSNDTFIRIDGEPCEELNPDTEALFYIGSFAFSRLFEMNCIKRVEREEFELCHQSYIDTLSFLRETMWHLQSEGWLHFQSKLGAEISVDLNSVGDEQIVSLCWNFYCATNVKLFAFGDESERIYKDLFLFHALMEVDHSLVGIALGGSDSVAAAVVASESISHAIAIESGSVQEQKIRREMASKGAVARLLCDPKQMAKALVKECWVEWRRCPDRYKSKAAFAKDMMCKFDELDSQTVIARWCAKWEKDSGG